MPGLAEDVNKSTIATPKRGKGMATTVTEAHKASEWRREAFRLHKVERKVHHVDLRRPHEIRVSREAVHVHKAGVEGLVSVRTELRHMPALQHLRVEAEKKQGVRVGRRLPHEVPVHSATPNPNLLLKLVHAGLGARVTGLNESCNERFLALAGLNAALFHKYEPRLALRILPKHDADRDRPRRDPALPRAFAKPEEFAVGTAEGHSLATRGVHEPRAALVDNGRPALGTDVRRHVFGDENRFFQGALQGERRRL